MFIIFPTVLWIEEFLSYISGDAYWNSYETLKNGMILG